MKVETPVMLLRFGLISLGMNVDMALSKETKPNFKHSQLLRNKKNLPVTNAGHTVTFKEKVNEKSDFNF